LEKESELKVEGCTIEVEGETEERKEEMRREEVEEVRPGGEDNLLPARPGPSGHITLALPYARYR
jgi:hypothetical protein